MWCSRSRLSRAGRPPARHEWLRARTPRRAHWRTNRPPARTAYCNTPLVGALVAVSVSDVCSRVEEHSILQPPCLQPCHNTGLYARCSAVGVGTNRPEYLDAVESTSQRHRGSTGESGPRARSWRRKKGISGGLSTVRGERIHEGGSRAVASARVVEMAVDCRAGGSDPYRRHQRGKPGTGRTAPCPVRRQRTQGLRYRSPDGSRS